MPRCSASWPVWNSYAATQLCLAGFAGDDTARAVFGQTSTEALDEFYIFSTYGELGPEVFFHSGNLVSTSPLYLAVIRVHASAMMAYGRISFLFYVKVYSI